MNRTEKQAFVDDFRSKVQEAGVLYLTDFSGLDVKSITVLRQRLRESGAEYIVVKNRLAKLAVADLDLPDISEALLGPTGVVLGYGGSVEPAKAVRDFAKEHDDKPVFKLGVLDNELVSVAEIERLAKLPPRDQLLAELAGALEAPMAAFASALEGKIQEMSGLLEALREQKESGGGAEAPPVAEEEAPPAAEEEVEAASPDTEAEEAGEASSPVADEEKSVEASAPDAEGEPSVEASSPDAEEEGEDASQGDAEDESEEASSPDAEIEN